MDTVLTWEELYQFMADVRAMAQGLLRYEGHAESLQTTALVLTALRRQKRADQDWRQVTWADREHFLAVMYRAMDQALKDHGRRRGSRTRRMGTPVPLDTLSREEALRTAVLQPHDLLHTLAADHALIDALTDALTALEQTQPQWVWVVKHRFYGGLTIDQTARMMGVAEKTVRRWWRQARVLLHDEILRIVQQDTGEAEEGR
jgi:DNA-directed RNA polymerase specialized sigma24 family protein